jgi:uncharacterized membrane protein YcaP (DUF421 family)
VANALQPAMTGPDTSFVGGLILIVALVGTNALIGRLDRVPRLHDLFAAPPSVIIRDGKYVTKTMQQEDLTQDEVDMAIREHGVKDLKEVQLGVLEPDGTISIVPTGDAMRKSRRKVRFIHRS